jgi:arylsulfatase A-like enzyme
VDEPEYLTDALAREATAFIERRATDPFFLYLPFNAVHTPMQAPEKYLARFPGIGNKKRRTLAAMLSAMDDAVGAVLSKLRDTGIEEQTLIVFISDNGGPTQGNGSLNTPLSGVKGQLLEGGIRVPFIVQWRNRLPRGKVYHQPVIALDILPTVVAAARGTIPENAGLDGVSLLPYLQGGKEGAPHEALYWRQGESMAIRKGSDKLLIQPGKSPQLFDLDADIGEQHDLATDEPQKAADLMAALEAWNETLAEPLWQRKPRARATQPGQEQRQRPRRRPARGQTGAAD